MVCRYTRCATSTRTGQFFCAEHYQHIPSALREQLKLAQRNKLPQLEQMLESAVSYITLVEKVKK